MNRNTIEYIITSEKAYHELMSDIFNLMNKNEVNLTSAELERLEWMAVAAEKYENEVLNLKQFVNRL